MVSSIQLRMDVQVVSFRFFPEGSSKGLPHRVSPWGSAAPCASAIAFLGAVPPARSFCYSLPYAEVVAVVFVAVVVVVAVSAVVVVVCSCMFWAPQKLHLVTTRMPPVGSPSPSSSPKSS